MSHNSYIRPSGLWGTNTPVFHGEMQAFDVVQFKAVNGDDGGTWANVSPIIFGGAFTVNGIVNLNGQTNTYAISCFGLAAFAGNIVVNSNSTFNGPIASQAIVASLPSWIPRRFTVETSDAGRTITVGATDVYVLPALPSTVWTTNHTVVLSRTGAVSGVSEFEVLNYDSARNIDVSDNGAGTLTTVSAPGGGGVTRKKFLFLAGQWLIAS